MKKSLLVVLSVLVLTVLACKGQAAPMSIGNQGSMKVIATTEVPRVTEAPETEAPTPVATVTACLFDKQFLQSYMVSASHEAFTYNEVPSSFEGHRFVIAVTYKDGTYAILYGEKGSTWIPDETVSTAMVNVITVEGEETECIANTFAEVIKPYMGDVPIMKIP